MHTLHVDLSVTRRQRLHAIVEDADALCFTAPKVGACLDWLAEHEIETFRIEYAGDGKKIARYVITMNQLLNDDIPT